MPKLPRSLLLGAAIIVGFTTIGRAQLLTADTITTGVNSVPSSYGNGAVLTNGNAFTQTFSNITSIDTLTLRLISNSNALGSAVSVGVYFSEWGANDATNLLSAKSINFDAPSTWTADSSLFYHDATIDFTSIASSLDNAKTYGFTLVGTSATAGNDIRIGGENGSAGYAGGSVFAHSGVSIFSNLTSGGGAATAANASPFTDFVFISSSAAAQYTPFAITPVPEASTMAVLFAGLFVGGMAFKRARDRRKQVGLIEA